MSVSFRTGVGVIPLCDSLRMKRCSKCGELKPLDSFYREKTGRDGRRSDCKDCFAVRAKDWYAKNRDQAIARAKKVAAGQPGAAPRVPEAAERREPKNGSTRASAAEIWADARSLFRATGRPGWRVCDLRRARGRVLTSCRSRPRHRRRSRDPLRALQQRARSISGRSGDADERIGVSSRPRASGRAAHQRNDL